MELQNVAVQHRKGEESDKTKCVAIFDHFSIQINNIDFMQNLTVVFSA